MGASTMVKKCIVVSLLFSVVLCATVYAWTVMRGACCKKQDCENVAERVIAEPVTCPPYGRKLAKSPRSGKIYWGTRSKNGVPCDFAYRIQTPQRILVLPDQSNAVAMAFADILKAYGYGDWKSMKAYMDNVPDVVTNMHDKVYLKLRYPLRAALDEYFLNVKSPLEFPDVESLDKYLRVNIELVLFLGNMEQRRGDYESGLRYDYLVLDQLNRYAKKYQDEGLECFEVCVDSFIEEWHRQIESENGFTRQYMWFQVDLQWPLYYEGSWTLDKLSAWAKQYASHLIKRGYTPKWLSEFDDLSEAVK